MKHRGLSQRQVAGGHLTAKSSRCCHLSAVRHLWAWGMAPTKNNFFTFSLSYCHWEKNEKDRPRYLRTVGFRLSFEAIVADFFHKFQQKLYKYRLKWFQGLTAKAPFPCLAEDKDQAASGPRSRYSSSTSRFWLSILDKERGSLQRIHQICVGKLQDIRLCISPYWILKTKHTKHIHITVYSTFNVAYVINGTHVILNLV